MKPNTKPTSGKPTSGLLNGKRTCLQPVSLSIVSCAAVCFTLLLAAGSLQAGQAIWVGDGTTSGTNWSNMASWSNSAPPLPGDDLIINDTTAPNSLMLNDDNHTIGLLQLGTNGMRTNAFTLAGTTNVALAAFTNTLTLTSGLVASNANNICLTIQMPLTLQGDQTWTVNCHETNIGTPTVPRGVKIGGMTQSGATNCVLTLNGALTKNGPGMLSINSPFRIGNGDIFVQEGSLLLGVENISRPLVVDGTGSIYVNEGARFMVLGGTPDTKFRLSKSIVMQTNASFFFGSAVGAGNATINSPVAWNGTNSLIHFETSFTTINFSNSWSGNSVVTLSNAVGVGSTYTLNLAGDNSGFSGMFNDLGIPSGTTVSFVRFQNVNAGSPNAEWSLNSTNAGFEVVVTNANIDLGALSGTAGTLRATVGTTNAASVTIGALNRSTTFGGRILNNSGRLTLVKVGNGTLTLTGTNNYTGGSVISNGALASLCAGASGVGTGPVSILNGATFSGIGLSTSCAVTNYAGGTLDTPGGTALSVDSLTCGVNGTDVTTTTINLAAGGLINAASSLVVNGTNIINVTGSVTNVGVYNLITCTGSIGGAGFGGFQLGSLPLGMIASLQVSGLALQLNVTSIVNTAPTNIVAGVSGGMLNLSWPADHLGWRLQCQTNSLGAGFGANWVPVPGSDAVTSMSIPIVTTNAAVFYRMVYP